MIKESLGEQKTPHNYQTFKRIYTPHGNCSFVRQNDILKSLVKKILHLRHLRKVRQSMPICPVLQLSFRGLLDNVNIFSSILLFYSQQISPKFCIRVFSCLIINSSFKSVYNALPSNLLDILLSVMTSLTS